MGVVSFSSSAKTEIQFSAAQNVKEIKASILNITYYAASTRIDLGLRECREELFTAGGGMRSNVPQVLLVITDGRSSGKAMHEFLCSYFFHNLTFLYGFTRIIVVKLMPALYRQSNTMR